MTPSELAAALGRRGGRARAARLSAQRRREIAAKGAAARGASLEAARRITANFRFLELVRAFAPEPPKVRRLSNARGRLPEI
jgi:hypothetical protein